MTSREQIETVRSTLERVAFTFRCFFDPQRHIATLLAEYDRLAVENAELLVDQDRLNWLLDPKTYEDKDGNTLEPRLGNWLYSDCWELSRIRAVPIDRRITPESLREIIDIAAKRIP
jgi:hypothetical protein